MVDDQTVPACQAQASHRGIRPYAACYKILKFPITARVQQMSFNEIRGTCDPGKERTEMLSEGLAPVITKRKAIKRILIQKMTTQIAPPMNSLLFK
jgi:hypothetical protein